MLTERENGALYIDWYWGKIKIWTWEGPEGNGVVQGLTGVQVNGTETKDWKSCVVHGLEAGSIELGAR